MGLNACHLRPDQNRIAGATVTVQTGAAASGYPVGNVKDGDVTLPVIASASGAFAIQFDLGSAMELDGFFVPMHNFPAGTNVRVQANSAASWASPPLDEPLVIPAYSPNGIPESVWTDLRNVGSPGSTYRYWRLSVPSFGSAAAIGEVLAGPLIEWTRNYRYGWIEEQAHKSIVKESAFGTRWTHRYALRQRRLDFQINPTDADVVIFKALDDACYTSEPFILVPDPTVNQALYVTIDERLSIERTIKNLGGIGFNTMALSVTEVPRGLPL